MIRYALICEQDHPFEAWFGSSSAYDEQAARGLVECPFCASKSVKKQIMSPAVAGTKKKAAVDTQAMMMRALTRAREHVAANFENVGDTFAREARDIHDGVSPDRPIYGQAKPPEIRALIEDGIQVAQLPPALAPTPKKDLN